MLRLMLLLYLIQGDLACRQYMNSNFSKEPQDIFDCFAQRLDMNWGHTEEETWRISRFLNYTMNLCDESYWRVFECFYPLLHVSCKARDTRLSAMEYLALYETSLDIEHLEQFVKLASQSVGDEEHLINTIEDVKYIANTSNNTKIFTDNCSRQLLNLETINERIDNNRRILYNHQFLLQILVQGNISMGSVYQDMGSKKPQDIFDCYTQRMDMDWRYSEEDMWRVSRFRKYAHNTSCGDRNWRTFECFYPLTDQIRLSSLLREFASRYLYLYQQSHQMEDLEKAVKLARQHDDTLGDVINSVREIMYIAAVRNEPKVLNDICSREILNLERLKDTFEVNKRILYYHQFLLHGNMSLVPVQQNTSSNFSKEPQDIVDCFTQRLDMNWSYSEEKEWCVSRFLNYTYDRCDTRHWRKFECYYPLPELERKFQRFSVYALNLCKPTQQLFRLIRTDLQMCLDIFSKTLYILERLLHDVKEIRRIATIRNDTRVIHNDPLKLLLWQQTPKSLLKSLVMKVSSFLTLLNLREHDIYYRIPFYVIILVFGTIGNALLLLIIVRHPEVRKGPILMLANLAVSDIFFLIVSSIFNLSTMYSQFGFSYPTCVVLQIARDSSVVANMYSITAMSVIRFVVSGTGLNGRCHCLLTSMRFMSVIIWVIATLISLPMPLYFTRNCISLHSRSHVIIRYVGVYLLPLIVTGCFSFATSLRLRNSAQSMPGEAVGHTKARRARERASKVFPTLAVLYVLTYIPQSLSFLLVMVGVDISFSYYHHLLYLVEGLLPNINASLNPVALYLSSSTFRKCFKLYIRKLLCKQTRLN